MKRALLALAAAAFTALGVPLPAGAATDVTHYEFHGTSAGGVWHAYETTGDTTTYIYTDLTVNKAPEGLQLYVNHYVMTYSPDGDTYSTMMGSATSGFTFTIDPTLQSAHVSGTIPVTISDQMPYSPIQQQGSIETTINLNMTWTGQGPIDRDVYVFKDSFGGVKTIWHSTGTYRGATASGNVGDYMINASSDGQAAMTRTNSGQVAITFSK